MSVTLAQIQTELKARLDAAEYFVDVPIVVESDKDFLKQVEMITSDMLAKAGKRGVAVMIGPTTIDVPSPDAAGPMWGPLAMNVTAYETPILNADPAKGTGKAALELCRQAGYCLHHYRPDGLAQTLYCDTTAIRPAAPLHADQIAYRLAIRIPDNEGAPDKVAPVVISPDSGVHPQTVTLTCATAAASIYYTLDESHPWSGNTAAVLYTAPLALAAAATVRAVAYKSGMIASDSALGLYT